MLLLCEFFTHFSVKKCVLKRLVFKLKSDKKILEKCVKNVSVKNAKNNCVKTNHVKKILLKMY